MERSKALDKERSYIAIDLKSFYASVECAERGLDPLTTNLVVADESRTEKTICLAVSPSLKSYGISGRARLFEVVEQVKAFNARKQYNAPGRKLLGFSSNNPEVEKDPSMGLGYIIAPPRMAKYMEISTQVYRTYLKYIAPEDIHVYSIDEVFIDATDYLKTYGLSARELAMKMIRDVLGLTGVTATAGIGTNLYLAKIAMDIVAKHMEPDSDGVRIAELDEMSYREQLWEHRPLTDFWRVGKGYQKKLEKHQLFTMGDIARCSLGKKGAFFSEDLLYEMFGVNAELLIDHAWGWEPCTMRDIKSYRPATKSVSSGQVLSEPYPFKKARLIVEEMTDLLVLDLVKKGLLTDQIVLSVGYDTENLKDPKQREDYKGEAVLDWYGRPVPKPAHGSINIKRMTSSTKLIVGAALELFDRIVDRNLTVRRMYVVANHIQTEDSYKKQPRAEQLDLFTDYEQAEKERQAEDAALEKERRRQQAILDIQGKYGKNAILKGFNLEEGATAVERNRQIGGHKA